MKKNRVRYPAGKGVVANVRVGGRANKTKLEELAKGVSAETVLKNFHSNLENTPIGSNRTRIRFPSRRRSYSSTKA
jgi:hypothetical protein